MKIFPLFVSSILALSCFNANAESRTNANNFNYDYAQIGYYFSNNTDAKGGLTLSTSYDIYDHVNILTNYSFSVRSKHKAPDKYKRKDYSLGLGYHLSLNDYMEQTDLFAELLLLNTHASATMAGENSKSDESGRALALGLRKRLTDDMELIARIDKPSVPVSDTIFGLGLLYKYSNSTTLGLNFNTGADDGSEVLTASMRWSL
ncbi:MAG: hypothetical protein KAH03_00090 [Cocleimonas sp.]|nr:hypothetical protein [Cocleimonas sp.]